jgi:hypothetical protein
MSRYTRPLARLVFPIQREVREFVGVGVAGGKGPLRRMAQDRRAADREESSSLDECIGLLTGQLEKAAASLAQHRTETKYASS